MNKRLPDRFGRRQLDFYPTPAMAIDPVIPHLKRTGVRRFVEPCVGDGDLKNYLESQGFDCVGQGDLKTGTDARFWAEWDFNCVDASITNPPWEAKTMMQIMERQSSHVPSWFLIYSDWIFTKQSKDLMYDRCTDIVPIGRVKWFPESTSVGYDNCCWVRMDSRKNGGVDFWPIGTTAHI